MKPTKLQNQDLQDASVEAVFRHHKDLTPFEVSKNTTTHVLLVCQSIYRLERRGIIEKRDWRRCGVRGKSRPAWTLTPAAFGGCK